MRAWGSMAGPAVDSMGRVMKKLLIAGTEAGLLLLFATGAMAALFDPSAAPLEWQGTALSALLLLVLTRTLAVRRLKPARVARDRS